MALQVVDRAIQSFGAEGVSQDTPLAPMWAGLRTLRLADVRPSFLPSVTTHPNFRIYRDLTLYVWNLPNILIIWLTLLLGSHTTNRAERTQARSNCCQTSDRDSEEGKGAVQEVRREDASLICYPYRSQDILEIDCTIVEFFCFANSSGIV